MFYNFFEKIKANNNNTTIMENKEDLISNKSVKELIEIAECYLFGRGNTKKNEKKAVDYLRKGAFEIQDEDSLQAQTILAFCYEFGLGVETDFKKCEKLYLDAAKRGNGLAQTRIAFLRR